MDNAGGTDDEEDSPGRRLEGYIKARWTRRKGGMLKLAGLIGSSTETMYAWFRGDSEPSMAHLRAVADQLGVRRAVLVAVLDGDPLPGETDSVPVSLEARLRAVESELQSLRAQSTTAGSPAQRARSSNAG